MDSTRDHRHRIAAATQMDQLFDTYEVEMTPEDVLSFAANAPGNSEVVYNLIDAINQSIPPIDFGNHPKTGSLHHRFRVGRRYGDRIVILEIFQG